MKDYSVEQIFNNSLIVESKVYKYLELDDSAKLACNSASNSSQSEDMATALFRADSNLTESYWLHGSSSGALVLMSLMNHNALVPAGTLRKKYNLAPFCGELREGLVEPWSGTRKSTVSYNYISGVRLVSANLQNANAAKNYAKYTSFSVAKEKETFQERCKGLVKLLEEKQDAFSSTFPRLPRLKQSIKYLEMNLIRLRYTEENWASVKNEYLQYVNQLQSILDQKNDLGIPTTLSTEESRVLNKYLIKFREQINSPDLTFVRTEDFTTDLHEQFPITFASSSITSIKGPKGLLDEYVVEGEIDLEQHIQYILTPIEHKEKLGEMLSNIGLTNIEVVTYKNNQHENDLSTVKSSRLYEEKSEEAESEKNGAYKAHGDGIICHGKNPYSIFNELNGGDNFNNFNDVKGVNQDELMSSKFIPKV